MLLKNKFQVLFIHDKNEIIGHVIKEDRSLIGCIPHGLDASNCLSISIIGKILEFKKVKDKTLITRFEIAGFQGGNMDHFEIDNYFTYHQPKDDQAARYQAIREAAKQLGYAIIDHTPQCADQTAAIRKIREAVMTANAAIACNE